MSEGAPRSGGTVPGASLRAPVRQIEGTASESTSDLLAVEEPLEIRVVAEAAGRRERHAVAVTMRTPGHDEELAAGFLLTEGVVTATESVYRIGRCDRSQEPEPENVIEVTLAPGTRFDPRRFSRHVYTSSSCGICGKASIELVRAVLPSPPGGALRLSCELLHALPGRLVSDQVLFARTGGLHAAALFAADGEMLLVREDVGRHNAVDKLIGALFLDGRLPASGTLLLVSGRASFELVQKAAIAGIPALAAVGAPSSLAVRAASELGMTLIGFLRQGRFNLYTGEERVDLV